MQVLIMYYSMGGRTKNMAEAIARGVHSVEGAACVIKAADEVTKEDLISSSALIAGSPSYLGTMAADLKKVFEKNIGIRDKMCGKVGAAFAGAAETPGGAETTLLSIIQAMLIYGMVIAGTPVSTASGYYGAAITGNTGGGVTDRDSFELGRNVVLLAMKLSK
ncbi:MAG TPA: flavodoxin family protein [Candidatus Wallbacteria bacterium]|nr:flavodoxin family protein [Candidatus Wallbacteria bacterium]